MPRFAGLDVARDVASASFPVLTTGTCQVWWASVDDVRTKHDMLLSDTDLARRSRLREPRDQQRLTAAWAVARLVLGSATGTPPDRLQVDRRCPRCGAPHGKPWLPAAPDLQLSVAHSGGWAVVAVCRGSAVGVDVERVVRLEPSELDVLLLGTLAEQERTALAGLSHAGRARAFTTVWTRKEAVGKATGAGLASPPSALVVSPAAAPPEVLGWDGRDHDVSRSTLHDLRPPPGFAATLAVLGDERVSVVEFGAGPLLRGAAGA